MFDHEEYSSLSPEEQFRHPMPVEIPHNRSENGPDGFPLEPEGRPDSLDVYDVRPLILEYETPVFFVPGWTGTAEGFRDNMLTMAQLGRRSLAVSSLRGIHPTESMPGFPLAEARKMSALLVALEKKGLDQTDVVAHSEGAIHSAMAATLHPEKFRNLLLVSPAGLMGQDSWFRLLGGFGRDVFEQLAAGADDERQKDKAWKSLLQVGRALRDFENFKVSVEEVQAIIDSHIEKLLIDLKNQGHRITIIHDVDDQEFPMDRLQKIVKPNMVDGFLSVRGHHHVMFAQPELYTRVINDQLIAMEKKQT